jgi:hypothetical protein
MFSDSPLLCALRELGEDAVMFSVDHPFESMATASKWFDDAPISASVREKISSGTATASSNCNGGISQGALAPCRMELTLGVHKVESERLLSTLA